MGLSKEDLATFPAEERGNLGVVLGEGLVDGARVVDDEGLREQKVITRGISQLEELSVLTVDRLGRAGSDVHRKILSEALESFD